MEETKVILGKVTVTPKGNYDRSKTYEILDIVSYNGSSYISKINNNTSLPTTETWQLIAQKGDTYEMQQSDFDRIVSQITEDASSEFNQNVTQKTNTFNTNATQKTDAFNSNATSKTNDYNTNATNKVNEFNQNARNKTSDFDDNASEKTVEFDTNAEVRLEEYNKNADELINKTSELEKEMDDYIGILPKKEATGNTLLEYDKALEFRVLNSEIEGNEYQLQTTGKNLLIYPYATTTPYTEAGLTWSEEKGKITTSGTPTAYSHYRITTKLNVKSNTDYRLYIVGTQTNIAFDILSGNNIIHNGLASELNNAGYIFNTGNYEEISIEFKRASSNQPTSANFYPMLVIGTDTISTDYEPYTGNKPSPSPDYPQEIETLKPYNLFNPKEFASKSPSYYSYDESTDKLKILKLDTREYKNFSEEQKIILPNGNYSINTSVGVRIYDPSHTEPIVTNNFNVTNGFIYLKLISATVVDIQVQIKKGTEQKQYVPYGCIAKKYVGKNLLNYYDFTPIAISNGKQVINDEIIDNTPGSDSRAWGYDNADWKIKLKKGNYSLTLWFSKLSTTLTSAACTVYKKDNTKIVGNLGNIYNVNKTNISFDLNEDTEIGIMLKQLDGICKIQLKNGNENDYEPYHERIQYIDLDGNELLSTDKSITDYKGNSEIVKNWNKIVLDGSEDWHTTSAFEGYLRFSASILPKNINDNNNGYNTHFIQRIKQSHGDYEYLYLLPNSDSIYIQIKNTRVNDLDTFKEWLKENKPIVYYQLAEPEIIELPKVELVKSLEGYNHVEVLATLEPTSMKETYAVDLQAEIEELKQAIISTGANI